MNDGFVRFHCFLARNRRWVGLILLGLFAAVPFVVRHLTLNEDYTDMLPMSNPAIAGQVAALKHIRQADRLFVDVSTSGTDAELLNRACDQLQAELTAIPELTDIRDRIDLGEARQILEQLAVALPWLLSSNDLRALESKLDPGPLRERLAWFKKALSQPQGLTLQSALETDPVGIGDWAATKLRGLKAGISDANLVGGRITSADSRHVLISALPLFPPSQTGKSRRLVNAILTAGRRVEGQFPPGSLRIAVSGAHRVALDNATMIQRDSLYTGLAATAAVALLLCASYRRPWLSLLGLIPTLFGGIGALAASAWIGEPVSAVALGCGSILIGVTVDYGIYLLYHLDDATPKSRWELAQRASRLWPTVTFGALTTAIAFLVMLASPISGHRQLGRFGAVCVATSAFCAIVVLPVFFPLAGKTRKPWLRLTRLMESLFAWRDRSARWVLSVFAALTLACGFGLGRLQFDGDLNRLNGMTPETRRDEEIVRSVWGKALSLTTIVTAGDTWDQALQANERVCAVVERLKQERVVQSFSSVASFLPSAQTQTAHLHAWREFWTQSRVECVSNSLRSAATDLGFRPGAFQSFFERLAPEQQARLESNQMLNRVMAEYVDGQSNSVSICTLVKVQDSKAYHRLRETILREVPNALLLNKAALSEEIAGVAKQGLPKFALIVVLLNAAILFAFLGRLELVAIALLPMAAGVFWTLGTMGLCAVPIDMSNFIFVIFVIGVGGDFSLFLLMAELGRFRGGGPAAPATGAAVTLCAMTSLLGVGILVLAQHPALFSIGLSALLGISFSLTATQFLVPYCVQALAHRERRRLEEEQKIEQVSLARQGRRIRRVYRYQGAYVSHFVAWKLRLDPLFQALDHAVPKKARILDLGCGYGMAAHWLTFGQTGRSVLGVDVDEVKLRIARATAGDNLRLAFANQNLLTWTQYPACDTVLLCDVLHYFPRDLKLAILQKAYQALPKEGTLVLRDAAADHSFKHRLVVLAERWAVALGCNRTLHGLHFESAAELSRLVQQAGFARVAPQHDAGLGSNIMLVAAKSVLPSSDPQPA